MPRKPDPNSLRQRLYQLFVDNENLSSRKYASLLRVSYEEKGNYLRKLLSEFRNYRKFGLPLAPHLPHKRVFVWENVPRGLTEPPLGWSEVANRNKMWIYRDDRGSVHWYQGGLVRLYLRSPAVLARAKELFCRAFSFMSWEEVRRYVEVPLREESKHWVFELGAPVPRFDIRHFERSHGMRIFTDKSHPTAIEVAETTPFCLDKLENVQVQFAENLDSHLNMIKSVDNLAQEKRSSLSREDHYRKLYKRFVKWR